MAKKMLIDATHPEETRVVVVDGNKVDDFDFESINKRQLAGNIYLAKVTRVEPSLQAAFVEYGGNRHGFLAFSEIHPDYYQIPIADREALLAEEAAEAEERARREDEGSDNNGTERERKSKRNRGRGRRRKKDDSAQSVAGLEVIDVVEEQTGENGDAPRGLEIADAALEAAPDTLIVTDHPAEPPEQGDAAPEGGGQTDVEHTDQTSADTPADREATEATVTPEIAEQTANGPDEAADATLSGPGEDAGLMAEDADTKSAGAAAQEETNPSDTMPGADETGAGKAPAPQSAEPPAAPASPASETDIASVDDVSESDDGQAPRSNDPDAGAEGPEQGSPDTPRTIAESAGLDDDDRISEEVPGADRRKTDEDPQVAENEPTEAVTQEDTVTPVEPKGHAVEEAPDTDHSADQGQDATEAIETDAAATDQSSGKSSAQQAKSTSINEADEAAAEDLTKTNDDASGSDPQTASTETGAADAEAATGAGAGDEDDDESDERPRRRSRKRAAASDDDAEDEDDIPDEPEQVGAEDTLEEAARARTRLRRKYKIQDVVKVRQIMLVQVVKEERGNKGAALTTYLSLAGRYCVLMPNTARGGGISRKITNASDRKRLREITGELDVPQGMGLIVRTAGAERTRAEIKRDYEFLLRQWEQIRDLTMKSIAPTLIYEEGSLIKRSIRDIYSKDIDQILVEGETGYREAKEYMKMLMPSHAKNVQPYQDPIPLFSRYQVESYLNGMFNPVVQLKSGGYIVIGITEALVAIDVNSGRATKQGSIEETALQTNLEAADEVARQLRLRDLAGLIVIDFIDMDENRNNRAVEKRMKDRLKSDRARIQVGRISAFGLMEMSRQRLRPGMLEATTQTCPTCQGIGYVRSDESMALSILRELEEEGVRNRADQVVLKVPVVIANYLINQKRDSIALIEERHGLSVAILADPELRSPDFEVERSKSQTPRPQRRKPVVTADSVVEDADLVEDAPGDTEAGEDEGKSRRRRGKRGGRRKRGQDAETEDSRDEQETVETEEAADDDDRPRKRGRGRRRGGRGRKSEEARDASTSEETGAASDGDAVETEQSDPGTDTTAPSDVPATAEAEHKATSIPEGQTDAGSPIETQSTDEPAQADDATAPTPTSDEDVAAETASDTDARAETDSAEQTAPSVDEDGGLDAKPSLESAKAPTASSETDVAAQTAQQTVAEPAPDADVLVQQEPVDQPQAEEKAEQKPKRRGWWSLGR